MVENPPSLCPPPQPDTRKWYLRPVWVVVIAALLPGFGHVLLGQPKRGLMMQVYMILLGLITWHLTTPAQSLVGRLAGGFFIYAISVMEAYRMARHRWLTQNPPA